MSNDQDVVIHELKLMPLCAFCNAKRFEYETPTFCCYNGEVKLSYSKYPDELLSLFTSQLEEGIKFRKNIRAYNSIFSFTSFGVNLDKNLASSRKGVYTFRAQGQIYHDLPSLLPEDRPRYFQLYFYDTEHEVQNRIKILQDGSFDESITGKLMVVLQNNPYTQIFRSLKDIGSFEDIQIHIASNVKVDQRVYNTPTADQVAAIWIEGNKENVPFERDIVVHAHSGNRHRIKHYFSFYDSLQYPLLFPRGEPGWHQEIDRCTDRNEAFRSTLETPEEIIQKECQGIILNFYIFL